LNPSGDFYTVEQRATRNRSKWTLVQGVLAPLQFLVFLISLALIVRFLWTGQGETAATVSILIKTALLCLIMLTGAIWEREVFGQYLFAKPFFWEDVVSLFVVLFHTLYVVALIYGVLDANGLMWLALLAYLLYTINALQFLIKFRMARVAQALAEADATALEAAHPDLHVLVEQRSG
jgi:3-vinyl bacteriochlorophyllide hydratase